MNGEFSSAGEAAEAIYGELPSDAEDRDEANAGRDLERLDEQAGGSVTEGPISAGSRPIRDARG